MASCDLGECGRDGVQVFSVAVDEGCAEVGHVVVVEEFGVGVASGEFVVV